MPSLTALPLEKASDSVFWQTTLIVVQNTLKLCMPSWKFVSSRYFYSTFGLETTLFLVLVLCALLLFEQKRLGLLGVVAALLILTRGESVILVMILITFYYHEERKLPPLRVFVAPAVILIANSIFNSFYYGSILPHTLTAKIAQGKSGLWSSSFSDYWPNFIRLRYHFQHSFNDNVIQVAMLLSLAIAGVVAFRASRTTLILLLFIIGYTAFFLLLGIPHYFWYYSVYYLAGYVFAVLGLGSLYG